MLPIFSRQSRFPAAHWNGASPALWARALHHLGTQEIDLAAAATTLGAQVQYREDAERVRAALDRMLQ